MKMLIPFVLVLAVAGCALTPDEREQIGQAAAQAQAVADEATAMKAQLDAAIPALKQAGLLTAEKEQQIAGISKQLDDKIAAAKQALATFQTQLQSNPPADGVDVGIAAVQAAAPLLGPYGSLAVALAGIAAMIRGAYNRAAGRKLAQAIEAAKAKGAVNFADPETAAKISAGMGAAAKRIVDEAQGKALPLPI